MIELFCSIGLLCAVVLPCALLIRLVLAHERGDDYVPADPEPFAAGRGRPYWAKKRFYPTYEHKTTAVTMPEAVVQLAQASLSGEDCSFALRDALLEAGKPEMAEAFSDSANPLGPRFARRIIETADE
jgi:hypothetical protein